MKVKGNTGFIARDDQRRLLRVSGTDATDFLQSLITANVETLPDDTLRASALLTPARPCPCGFPDQPYG